MQTHPLLVTLPETIPSWIAGKPAKAILEVVNTACQQAGITGPAQFRFLVDPKGLTQRMPPCSLMLRPTAPYNRPDLVAFVACAQSPTQHRVHCTLTLPALQRDTFARFIQSQDNGIYVLNAFRNPVFPPSLQAAALNSETEFPNFPDSRLFDQTDVALFLADIRSSGGFITRNSLDCIAEKLTTGKGQDLIKASMVGGFVRQENEIYSITSYGNEILRKHIDATSDATKPKNPPALSEFDRLKAALIDARAQHQAAKAKHDSRAQELTTLTHSHTGSPRPARPTKARNSTPPLCKVGCRSSSRTSTAPSAR